MVRAGLEHGGSTRRLAILVGTIVLVDTMFYAAVTPLLPELSRDLNLSKQAAGVLTGAFAAGTLVGSLPAGWFAARAGVRSAVLVGLALMSVSGLAFAFGDDIVVLDVARFAQGIGGAFTWSGGLAWLAASVPRERRGAALGAAIFGVQLGPVLGAAATAVGREVAFSSAVAFGAALALWAWAMPAAPGVSADERLRTPASALSDRRMLAGMWLTILPAIGFGVLDVLAPLRLDVLGAGALVLGLTFFAAGGLEAVLSPIIGRLSDRRGPGAIVVAGLIASTIALVAIELPGTVTGLAVMIVLLSGLLGVTWVPAMGLLSSGAEGIGLDQGFAFAFFNLAWASGFMVGAAGGAGVAQAAGDGVAYAILAGLYAISAAIALTVLRAARHGADRRARYGVAS